MPRSKTVHALHLWTLAVSLGTMAEVLLRATHPPTASTALLVALGSFKPTLRDAAALVVGMLLVAGIGERLRLLRGHAWVGAEQML